MPTPTVGSPDGGGSTHTLPHAASARAIDFFHPHHFSRNARRLRPTSPHARGLAVSRGTTRGWTMSAISGGGNYISDGQIMEWLASQQDRIYGDLKESIDLAD